LQILHRSIAGDAFYDSAERFPQPRCHPDTRTKLLDVFWNWAYEDNQPSTGIIWLHGPAGSGKSAVAQSLCQRLKDGGRLGGSFFFKRGHPSRGNAKRLFPTLAYQLALLPKFKQSISDTTENDLAIVDRVFSEQLHNLIIAPCQKARLSRPISIVIDGLDECEGEEIQQEVLRSIGNAVSQERLPILFFIASRPESHIWETFEEPCLRGCHRPFNVEQSFKDVRKYLLGEFHRIHREHWTMAMVPYPWPPSKIVGELVDNSSGYFIYASTVIKFVDDKRFRPAERLDIVLGIKNSISGSPFETLDQLYLQILSGVPIDFRAQFLKILACIAAPWLIRDICSIEQLLHLEPGDVRLILRGLHSVIREEDSYLSFHHASFHEFLTNPSRSGAFCVSAAQCRTDLTHDLLEALSHDDPLLNKPDHISW
ncbi:hypothetical protein B0H13DRAFT_1586857, partial [Mycena leptocephala]